MNPGDVVRVAGIPGPEMVFLRVIHEPPLWLRCLYFSGGLGHQLDLPEAVLVVVRQAAEPADVEDARRDGPPVANRMVQKSDAKAAELRSKLDEDARRDSILFAHTEGVGED